MCFAKNIYAYIFLGFLVTLKIARCQQVTPFQGQNTPPAGGLDVYVSVSLDHMISINNEMYQFEAVTSLHFSWVDFNAVEAVKNATERGESTGSCDRPCSGTYKWVRGDPCCEGMFLPHFEILNARGFDENRVIYSGIQVNNITGAVAWWARTQGVYYVPMSFSSYPFDQQYLTIQVMYADRAPDRPVRLVTSASLESLYQPASGDLISGWQVNALSLVIVDTKNSTTKDTRLLTVSNPYDPCPLSPTNESVVTKEPFKTVLTDSTGFYIVIEISRISSYYVLNAIIPVVLTVWLSFFVFAISPKHVDSRIGLIFTLFIALSALQYVLLSMLPASTTIVPTQQVILVSYFVLAIIAVMSVGTFQLAHMDDRRKQREKMYQAQQRFADQWVILKSSFTGSSSSTMGRKWFRKRDNSDMNDETVLNEGSFGRSTPHASEQSTHYGGIGLFVTGESDRQRSDVDAFRRTLSNLEHEERQSSVAKQSGASEGASQKQPHWMRLQCLKVKEMWRAAHDHPDYALFLAERIDFWCFLFVLIAYNVAVILILALQSNDDPSLEI